MTKEYAQGKKPSMKRRSAHHDYTSRRMYMVTLVVQDRRPLFGHLEGDVMALRGTPDAPRLVASPLGQAVEKCWKSIPSYHPEVRLVALQLMPDHLHGILFVTQKMEKPLGAVINGFKTGCTQAYKQLLQDGALRHLTQQQTTTQRATTTGKHAERATGKGLLFELGYNDQILLETGQLDKWTNYLADNPRRLMAKRLYPDLFRVQRGLTYAGMRFSAIGNRWLLTRPKLRIQCSRRLTPEQIQADVDFALDKARKGRVMVSPRISPGEKAIMDAAFAEGHPIILLVENGFTDFAKPQGRYFDACAEGRMLILAPWEHHNEKGNIRRSQCMALNDMARKICEEG